jgi:hypothetical protein
MRCDQTKNNSINLISSPVINEKLLNNSLITGDIWRLRLQLFTLGENKSSPDVYSIAVMAQSLMTHP